MKYYARNTAEIFQIPYTGQRCKLVLKRLCREGNCIFLDQHGITDLSFYSTMATSLKVTFVFHTFKIKGWPSSTLKGQSAKILAYRVKNIFSLLHRQEDHSYIHSRRQQVCGRSRPRT